MIISIEIKKILLYILTTGLIIGSFYSFLIYFLLIKNKYKRGFSILYTLDIEKLFRQLIKDEQNINKKKFYQIIWKSYAYLAIFLLLIVIIYLLIIFKINKIF